MILDDKIAFNLIVELMQIRFEDETIEETQGWINEQGLEKVFEMVLYMHTSMGERMIEYPYVKTEQTNDVEATNEQKI